MDIFRKKAGGVRPGKRHISDRYRNISPVKIRFFHPNVSVPQTGAVTLLAEFISGARSARI